MPHSRRVLALTTSSHGSFYLFEALGIKDLGGFPCASGVLANLLGSELVNAVKPAGTAALGRNRGTKTQLGILAGAHQQHRPFGNLGKAGAMAEAAVACQNQNLVAATGIV
jgi:hypothetical protein